MMMMVVWVVVLVGVMLLLVVLLVMMLVAHVLLGVVRRMRLLMMVVVMVLRVVVVVWLLVLRMPRRLLRRWVGGRGLGRHVLTLLGGSGRVRMLRTRKERLKDTKASWGPRDRWQRNGMSENPQCIRGRGGRPPQCTNPVTPHCPARRRAAPRRAPLHHGLRCGAMGWGRGRVSWDLRSKPHNCTASPHREAEVWRTVKSDWQKG